MAAVGLFVVGCTNSQATVEAETTGVDVGTTEPVATQPTTETKTTMAAATGQSEYVASIEAALLEGFLEDAADEKLLTPEANQDLAECGTQAMLAVNTEQDLKDNNITPENAYDELSRLSDEGAVLAAIFVCISDETLVTFMSLDPDIGARAQCAADFVGIDRVRTIYASGVRADQQEIKTAAADNC